MGFDALLWLSFGGPEGLNDVLPFLRNVTRGRGVPEQRLEAVAEHYRAFGGVSPINECNRAAIKAVEAELDRQGIGLRVYFGNRNWHPYAGDAVARMAADGVRRALVFATSAYGGYSSCRQYDEDIVHARAAVPDAPDLVKLRQFFDHPLFIECFADAVAVARESLPAAVRAAARLVFTAHSIPTVADQAAGTGRLYSRQVAEAARLVAGRAGFAEWDVAWQSRSGPPRVPWLEPDIVDHLGALGHSGTKAVVVCPIGFVSDHLEVRWDLDHEAAQRAAELGMAFARAATPNDDGRFARMVVELVAERVSSAPARKLSQLPAAGATANGAPCADDCCLR